MNRFIHSSLTFLSLVALTFHAGCRQEEKPAETSPAAQPDSAQTRAEQPVDISLTKAQYQMAGIELGQPQLRTLSGLLKVNGVLDVPPQSQVTISVPFGGYIRRIPLEQGMSVRKGQTLVTLENPDYIQLQQDYLDTKARLEFADQEFVRQQELSRENVTALKAFQQTASNRKSLQAQLAGLSQRLTMLGIPPTAISPDHLTRVVAVPSPVSGFITSVPVNAGRFINPADVIAEVTDMSHSHIRLNIFEQDIPKIRVGQTIRFAVGADASPVHTGRIFMLGKSLSTDRTLSVLAHSEGNSADFIPGAYVSAQVAVQNQATPTLPDEAIVRFGGKQYVYILQTTANGQYRFRQIEVKTGLSQQNYSAVTLPADIDPRQTPVVVKGAYSLLSQLNNHEEE